MPRQERRPKARVSLSESVAGFAGRVAGRFAEGFRSTGSGRGFDPGVPLPTTADKGEPPRTFEVRTARNLAYVPRSEDERLAPFQTLRALADGHSVTRALIQDIKNTMIGLDHNIVTKEGEKDQAKTIRELEDFFSMPDAAMPWDAWLSSLLEELLVIDAATLLPITDRARRPLGLRVIDGSTIKPLVDVLGGVPFPPDPAYQQILYGRPETEFTIEELMYRPKNRRPWTPYGQSPVEQVTITINLALRRELHYLAYYSHGNLPDALYATPKSWTDKQIRAYQQYFDDILSGASEERAGSIRFVPGGDGANYFPTKDEQWKYEFDEYLCRVLAWAFGRSPMPIAKMVNRASGEEHSRSADLSGIEPLRRFIKRIIDEYLVRTDNPTIEFQWIKRRQEDERLRLDEDTKLWAIGGRTLNQIKEARGEEPYKEDWADKPMIQTVGGVQLLEEAIKPKPQMPFGASPFGRQPEDEEEEQAGGKPGGDEEEDEEFEAAKADLGRWCKRAVKDLQRGRGNARPFVTKAIPADLQAFVNSRLGDCTTDREIRDLFKSIKLHKKPRRKKRRAPAVERAQAERGLFNVWRAALNHMLPAVIEWGLESLERGCCAGVLERMTKVGEESIEPSFAKLIDKYEDFLEELIEGIAIYLKYAHRAGAASARLTIGLDMETPPALALSYAEARAAELVGRKIVAGKLVPNPNKKWVITESLRREVHDLVQAAIEEGWSPQKLASGLREHFGKWRAETIARTETARAYNAGAAESWKRDAIRKVDPLDGTGCLPIGHDDNAPDPDTSREGVQYNATVTGQRWTVEEYAEHLTGHPNCVRGAAPIVPGFENRRSAIGFIPMVTKGYPEFDPGQARDDSGRWTSGGPTVEYSPGLADVAAKDLAKRIRKNAEDAEAEVTDLMQRIAGKTDGTLKGLQYRLKTEDSILKKLKRYVDSKGLSVTDAAKRLPDALRYTVQLDRESYQGGIDAALDMLHEEGWATHEITNAWADPYDTYNGLHVVLKRADLKIEVQFHTPLSYTTKVQIHPIYQKFRNPRLSRSEKRSLYDKMAEAWRDVPVPVFSVGGTPEIYPRP